MKFFSEKKLDFFYNAHYLFKKICLRLYPLPFVLQTVQIYNNPNKFMKAIYCPFGDGMKLNLLILLVVGTAVLFVPFAQSIPVASEVSVSEHHIIVNENDVYETITFMAGAEAYTGVLTISAPDDYTAYSQGLMLTGTWADGQVQFNLSSFDLRVPAGGLLQVNITTARSDNLERSVIYPTAYLTLTLDVDDYPQGNIPLVYGLQQNMYTSDLYDVAPDQEILIQFVAASEHDTIGFLTLVLSSAVVAMAILLLLTLRWRGRDRRLETEPDDALQLRRRLLTDALKTLEIEHDTKKIPDTYYHSIKDYFKNEAVRVLRELDRRS